LDGSKLRQSILLLLPAVTNSCSSVDYQRTSWRSTGNDMCAAAIQTMSDKLIMTAALCAIFKESNQLVME
jgi:hypothetical protein